MVTYAKISPKSGEPQRYSWGTQKKNKNKNKKKQTHIPLLTALTMAEGKMVNLKLNLFPNDFDISHFVQVNQPEDLNSISYFVYFVLNQYKWPHKKKICCYIKLSQRRLI